MRETLFSTNAKGMMRFAAIQKCALALRVLRYDNTTDQGRSLSKPGGAPAPTAFSVRSSGYLIS